MKSHKSSKSLRDKSERGSYTSSKKVTEKETIEDEIKPEKLEFESKPVIKEEERGESKLEGEEKEEEAEEEEIITTNKETELIEAEQLEEEK